MSVQYAGNQFMSKRLVAVIQELRDYLGPDADGLSVEDVVHKVMCKALEYQAVNGDGEMPNGQGKPSPAQASRICQESISTAETP